eukprot:COSAG02_NODE_3338_length_6903_cov_13.687537_8_plen_101_part_01
MFPTVFYTTAATICPHFIHLSTRVRTFGATSSHLHVNCGGSNSIGRASLLVTSSPLSRAITSHAMVAIHQPEGLREPLSLATPSQPCHVRIKRFSRQYLTV